VVAVSRFSKPERVVLLQIFFRQQGIVQILHVQHRKVVASLLLVALAVPSTSTSAQSEPTIASKICANDPAELGDCRSTLLASYPRIQPSMGILALSKA
jgi:hypothetical protein